MATVAIYSLKGGVGKTTMAVNLAWASARASRRTLVWDLDAQGAATYLLGDGNPRAAQARSAFTRDVVPARLVVATATPRLDLLPADASLRALDRVFHDLAKKKRLARLIETLGTDYDRVILDCPPGLTETSDQILRAADLVLVPVIPSALSRRALAEMEAHLGRLGGGATLLPVWSMVDRRRALHRDALAADPLRPFVPMASAVEAMTEKRAPLAGFAPASPAAAAFARLWTEVERRLTAPPPGK